MGEMDSAVLAMIENLQRQDLHFFEEAEGLANLMADYGFTQEALAVRVGKTQSTVANKVRILKLPDAIRERIVESGLTERHARALLRLHDENRQMDVLKRIIKYAMNVRKTEELIEKLLQAKPAKQAEVNYIKHYIRDIRILTNSIKENLDVMRQSGIDTRFDMVQTEKGYDIHISLVV
jgi:ParB family chromosome partitioning protein